MGGVNSGLCRGRADAYQIHDSPSPPHAGFYSKTDTLRRSQNEDGDNLQNFEALDSYDDVFHLSIPFGAPNPESATSIALSGGRSSSYSMQSRDPRSPANARISSDHKMDCAQFGDFSGDRSVYTRTSTTTADSRRETRALTNSRRTEKFVDEGGNVIIRTHITDNQVQIHFLPLQFQKYEIDPNFVIRLVPTAPEERIAIHRLLRRGYMFRGLDAEQLDLVVDSLVPRNFHAGEVIFREGTVFSKSDDGLYILDHGIIDWFRGAPSNPIEDKHCTYSWNAQYFGELSLLTDGARERTCVARTDCSTWCMTRHVFNNIVRNTAIDERIHLNVVLRDIPLTKNLQPEDLVFIADNVRTVVVQKGAAVEERDSDDLVYIVESGACEGLNCNSLSKMFYCSDYFGDVPFLPDENRAHRVTAYTDKVKLLALEAKLFAEIFGDMGDDVATGQNNAAVKRFVKVDALHMNYGASEDDSRGRGYAESPKSFITPVITEDPNVPIVAEESPPASATSASEVSSVEESLDEMRLLSYMQRGYAFTGLSADKQLQLVTCARLVSIRQHTMIVDNGKISTDGRSLYILDSGVVDVFDVANESSELVKVFTYTESGQCIWDHALLDHASRELLRGITMKTKTACKLWYFQEADLVAAGAKSAAIAQRRHMELFFTRNFRPFDVISETPHCSFFLSALTRHEFCRGKVLIMEKSTPAEEMFFLERGTCSSRAPPWIDESDERGSVVSICNGESYAWKSGERLHEAGDYFGEVALLLGTPRRATVTVTSEKVIAWELSRVSFQQVMVREMIEALTAEMQVRYQEPLEVAPKKSPSNPMRTPERTLASKTEGSTRLELLERANAGFFADLLDESSLSVVLDARSWVFHRYPPYSIVTIQREKIARSGPGLFVILRGEVKVHCWPDELHPGDIKIDAMPRNCCCGGVPSLDPETCASSFGPILTAYTSDNLFGPLAGSLNGDTWNCTIVTNSPTSIWWLQKDIFDMYVKNPLALEIERRREAVRHVGFFVSLPTQKRHDCLIEALQRVKAEESGTSLMKVGAQMDRMFIILRGKVIELAGESRVHYCAGDVIGERAMYNAKKCLANELITDGPVEALVLLRSAVYHKRPKQPKNAKRKKRVVQEKDSLILQ